MSKTNIWPQWRDKLAGGWKCVKFEMYDGSGPSKNLLAKPHGDSPLGRVVLSPGGYLSAHMARPERYGPLPSGNPWQTGEDKEVAYVARGLSMYCGPLQLFEDEEGLFWETTVEVSSDPTRKGGIEVRRLKYSEEEGGRKVMVLQPKQDLILEDGRSTRAILTWEKFE